MMFFKIDDHHPHCPHGKTMLIWKTGEDPQLHGIYVCAAHRDKRSCSFHLQANSMTRDHLSRRYVDSEEMKKNKLMSTPECRFCFDCNEPYLQENSFEHDGHEVYCKETAHPIPDPTQLLRPMNENKGQAQYFFDEKALKLFAKTFLKLRITKVICIGAPRLHAHLLTHCREVQSFLLDLDHRFHLFYGEKQFALYNMCNNYFFDEKQANAFKQFLLRSDHSERVLLFIDPPFGCRTELIAFTLMQLTRQYNKVNKLPHGPLPVMWIFPYFSEHHVSKVMPQLAMSDYKVNYTNHTSYTDMGQKCRKLGSPVRIFTNIPLNLIELPVTEEYKYCARCSRYTALMNRHCNECDVCPSKNGDSYRHCTRCGICVKPNYVHCDSCRRCTQAYGHNCAEYQTKQRCWICNQQGHIETQCKMLELILKPDKASHKRFHATPILCLICSQTGHNERHCPKRDLYFDKSTFMGETELKLKIGSIAQKRNINGV